MSDRMILERSFPQGLAMTDGRTVEGRCVPYGVVADIWSPEEGHYKEVFDHGAFERVVRAPQRVIFRISHSADYANMVGYGTDLEERDDGLYGSFRLLEADAPKAKELISASYRGLSVGFLPLNSKRVGDVLHRVKAHLDHVAAVVEGTAAYSDAVILAMRQKEAEQGRKFTRDDVAEICGVPIDMINTDEVPDLAEDEALKALQAYNAENRQKLASLADLVQKRTGTHA